MLTAEQKEEVDYIKSRTLAAFPLLGVIMSKLEVEADDRAETAYTTGNKIVYSPTFFEQLSDDEEVFVFAHEVLHVAFEHISRSKERDSDLWNIATDAVINQLLQEEGLPIKDGLVNMPEALGKSAEEMYDILLERRKEKQKEWEDHVKDMRKKAKEMAEQQREQNGQTGEQPEQNGDEMSSEAPKQNQADKQQEPADVTPSGDDELPPMPELPELPEFKFNLPNHNIWKEITEQKQENSHDGVTMDNLEKQFSQQNQREQARQAMEYFQQQNGGGSGKTFHISGGELSDVKPAKELNWKRLLKYSLEKEVLKWSSKDACRENDYASKLVEVEVEDRGKTEVMLDISGSVNVELLKEFLRQLKPLVKDSDLEVGYFNGEATDFTPVKKAKDIEKLDVPCPEGWTDLDAAVRKFSKDKYTNKIVFTDGEGFMPREDLKKVNVIWVIYGNKYRDFDPCCGKVIYVDEKKIMDEARGRCHLIENSGKNVR